MTCATALAHIRSRIEWLEDLISNSPENSPSRKECIKERRALVRATYDMEKLRRHHLALVKPRRNGYYRKATSV
jgi:hypothetical protein